MYFDLRKYIIAVSLTALIWIMALTSFGSIPVLGVDVTLLCIPIILGTCALGLSYGLFLGLMFALTSLFMALMGRPVALLAPLLNFPLEMYLTIFIPRLLIPVFTWLVFKATTNWKAVFSYGISTIVGSFANTLLFLGFAYILGSDALTEAYQMSNSKLLAALGDIVLSNGLLEVLVALIVCTPALLLLNKTLAGHGEPSKQ